MVSRRSAALGIGLGSATLGVAGLAVAGVIAVAFTEPLVSDPIALPAFGTPLEVIASLGMGLVLGAPLLAGAGGGYAVGTDSADLSTVGAGVLLGGLVLTAGTAVVFGAVFLPWSGPLYLLERGLVIGVIFAGTGTVGTLAGDLYSQLRTAPGDSNGAPL